VGFDGIRERKKDLGFVVHYNGEQGINKKV
jgi:hypothetical protein